MSIPNVPSNLAHLLERPLYATLATVGLDDTARVSPMWFDVVDGTIRFTHTTKRAKYRQLLRNPSMSMAVFDPDKPVHYVEVRGRLLEAIPDPTGAFYQHLSRRYGNVDPEPPADSADRVILSMSIDRVVGQ